MQSVKLAIDAADLTKLGIRISADLIRAIDGRTCDLLNHERHGK